MVQLTKRAVSRSFRFGFMVFCIKVRRAREQVANKRSINAIANKGPNSEQAFRNKRQGGKGAIVSKRESNDISRLKKILVHSVRNFDDEGTELFEKEECPEARCSITHDLR